MCSSYKWSLPFILCDQYFYASFTLPIHSTWPAHHILLDLIILTILLEWKLWITSRSFLTVSCYCIPVRSKYSPRSVFTNTPNLWHSFTPSKNIQTDIGYIVLCIFIFRFLTWRRYKYLYRFPVIKLFHRIRGSPKCFETWHLMCGERCQFSVQSPWQKTTPGQLSATANHVRYSIHCLNLKLIWTASLASNYTIKLHNT
jgi:hypothetical protein